MTIRSMEELRGFTPSSTAKSSYSSKPGKITSMEDLRGFTPKPYANEGLDTMSKIARDHNPTAYAKNVASIPTVSEFVLGGPQAFVEGMDSGMKSLVRTSAYGTKNVALYAEKYLNKWQDTVGAPGGGPGVELEGQYKPIHALLNSIAETGDYFANEPLFQNDIKIAEKYMDMSYFDPRKGIFMGASALPQIMAATLTGVGAAGIVGSTGVKVVGGIPPATLAKVMGRAQKIAFGTIASGAYQEQAGSEGATLEEQLAYGTIMGVVELVTEAPFFSGLNNVMGNTGIMRGANALGKLVGVSKLGKLGIVLGYEATQEAVAEAAGGMASKLIYDPDKPWTGEGGAFDPAAIADAAYGGAAMGLMIGGMALPFDSPGRDKTEKLVEKVLNDEIPTSEEIKDIADEVNSNKALLQTMARLEGKANETLLDNKRKVRGQEVTGDAADAILARLSTEWGSDLQQTTADNKENAKLIDAMSRLFNFEYIVAEGPDVKFNATYDAVEDVIVFNQAANKPVQALVGHEVAHRMKKRSPALYAQLVEVMTSDAAPKKMAEALANIKAQYKEMGIELTPDQTTGEAVSRYMEELFSDPAIIGEIASVEPSLAARIMKYIGSIIESIKKAGIQRTTTMSEILNNADKVKAVYIKTMQDYVQSELGSKQSDLREANEALKSMEGTDAAKTDSYKELKNIAAQLEDEIAGIKDEFMYDIIEDAKKKADTEAPAKKAPAKKKADPEAKKKADPEAKKKADPEAAAKKKAAATEAAAKAEALTEKLRTRLKAELFKESKVKLAKTLKVYLNADVLGKVHNEEVKNMLGILARMYTGMANITLNNGNKLAMINAFDSVMSGENAKIYHVDDAEVKKNMRTIFMKNMDEMTPEDVANLNDLIHTVIQVDKLSESLLLGNMLQHLTPVIDETTGLMNGVDISDMKDIKKTLRGFHRYFDIRLSPENAALQIVGWKEGTMFSRIMHENLADGVIEATRVRKEIQQGFEKDVAKVESFNAEKWSLKKSRVKVKFDKGAMDLNPLEKIYLYQYATQKDGVAHLIDGGFHDENSAGVIMTVDDINFILKDMLSADENKVADLYAKYDIVMQEYINEVSMKLYGIKIANIKNHAFLYVDKNTKRGNLASINTPIREQGGLEMSGRIMNRVKNPKSALLRMNAHKAFIDGTKFASKFHGLAIPVRNARALIARTELKTKLNQKFGSKALSDMQDYLDDVEGKYVESNDIDKVLLKIMRNVSSAYLSFTYTVVLKQIPSIMMGISLMDISPKGLAQGLANRKTDPHMLDSPVMWERAQGRQNREMYEAKNITVFGGEVGRKLHKVKEVGLTGIMKADYLVFKSLWNIKLAEHREKYGKIDYKKLEKEFNDLVRSSQPFWSATESSRIMRNPSASSRFITQFRTQREVIFNMLYRAAAQAIKTKDIKPLAKVVAAKFSANIMIAMVDSLRHHLRNPDDDDEIFKIFARLLALAAVGVDPLASMILNKMLSGYDPGILYVDGVNSLLSVTVSILDNPTDDKYFIRKSVKALSLGTGIGVENAWKWVKDTFQLTDDIVDGLK